MVVVGDGGRRNGQCTSYFFQSFRWQPWSSSTCTFQTLELLMDKPTSTTSNGTTTPLHSPTSKLGEFKHKSYFKVGWVWTQKLLKSWVNLNTKATAKLGKLKHKIHLKEVCTNFLSFFFFFHSVEHVPNIALIYLPPPPQKKVIVQKSSNLLSPTFGKISGVLILYNTSRSYSLIILSFTVSKKDELR